MGLNPKSNEKRTFINIVNGSFAKRVEKDEPDAKAREIESTGGVKKTIYELSYGSLSAMISGVQIKEDGDFGDQLVIDMVDVIDKFSLSIILNSREAKSFMSALPNIDLSKEVLLQPYNYVNKEGKKMIGMGICQGEKDEKGHYPKVPYFFTDETGLPKVPEGSDKDEFKLIMQQQTIFLKKKTKEFIASKGWTSSSPAPKAVVAGTPPVQTGGNTAQPPLGISDDLPF